MHSLRAAEHLFFPVGLVDCKGVKELKYYWMLVEIQNIGDEGRSTFVALILWFKLVHESQAHSRCAKLTHQSEILAAGAPDQLVR